MNSTTHPTTPMNRRRLYQLWAYLSCCDVTPTYRQIMRDVPGYHSTSLVGRDVRALVDLGYVEHPYKGRAAIRVKVKAGLLDADGNQVSPQVHEDPQFNADLDALALLLSQRLMQESAYIDAIGAYTR